MESKSVSKIYTLNKTTYINLRWIAILGQFLTVNVVKYVFNFEFDILIVNVVIALGVISNLNLISIFLIAFAVYILLPLLWNIDLSQFPVGLR